MSEQTQQAIGKILTGSEQKDAIHFAVAPVVAAHSLRPGDHVGLNADGEADNLTGNDIGVIDPFLKEPVRRGQRCWLFLYPNTITALRHNWTHPAFSDVSSSPSVAKSEKWMRDFAEEMGMSYQALLSSAEDWLDSGSYHTLNTDIPNRVYDDREQFWGHYEAVTGKKVSDKSEMFFTCSC